MPKPSSSPFSFGNREKSHVDTYIARMPRCFWPEEFKPSTAYRNENRYGLGVGNDEDLIVIFCATSDRYVKNADAAINQSLTQLKRVISENDVKRDQFRRAAIFVCDARSSNLTYTKGAIVAWEALFSQDLKEGDVRMFDQPTIDLPDGRTWYHICDIGLARRTVNRVK